MTPQAICAINAARIGKGYITHSALDYAQWFGVPYKLLRLACQLERERRWNNDQRMS
jgi:hypothetical protein